MDESYGRGQLTVRLIGQAGTPYTLQVDDDGTGMSQATMTKDMLDFGKSFWASERASREFPGLQSSGYSSVGRFGIGFFSVFMAASKVSVFSRRFDAGLSEVRRLSFDNGVSLRPVLSEERPGDMLMNTTTRVELELKSGVLEDPARVPVRSNETRQRHLFVSLGDYVAALAGGLEVLDRLDGLYAWIVATMQEVRWTVRIADGRRAPASERRFTSGASVVAALDE